MSLAKIAVVGLGNLMRTDDAVGMLAIERLRADPRLASDISTIEGGTLGLDLLYPLDGMTHLLALDAIDTGVEPGTLLRFEGEDVGRLPAAKSVHLLGFADLLAAMQLIDSLPREVVVLGVQPEVIAWGTALSAQVEGSLPELVDAAVAQIAQWKSEMAGGWLPQTDIPAMRADQPSGSTPL